jgi:hypothetical protein
VSTDLEEYVRAEGAGWSYPLDESAFQWKRATRYPTRHFLERPLRGHAKPWTRGDWKSWLGREIASADDPDYYHQLERAWLSDPSAFGEVIVAELPDGTIDVGDGWHRLAMSIARGRATVPAVVGQSAEPSRSNRGPMPSKTKTRHARKKKQPPYASESLAVSRRMVAPGPLHEERAIIHDLMTRYRHLQSTLPYYDRTTGKPIADEAEKLRKEAWRRIEALPEGDLRSNLTRRMRE